ncbi:MAG TPA: CehA/McbA family metallohydrolase [Candidatus Limnocylindria bacterium]|nr:CehA/McbA family metallohydrolase [Candidatus Limnocylindria bacterium]
MSGTRGRLVLLLAAALLACERERASETPPASTISTTLATSALPPTARRELLDSLREDQTLLRNPADGGGRVVLTDGPDPAMAQRPGRWTFEYTAGPLGIAVGGMLFFQPPPFWSWSPPQTDEPERPGFTTVETAAPGVTLDTRAVTEGLLAATVGGRGLAAGETVTLVYGAGPAGALADRYAERGSPFWFAVDGDGDGVRKLVADPPRITILPGPPARLVAHWPSVARPGEQVPLVVAALDAAGNAGTALPDPVFVEAPPGLAAPPEITLGADGTARVMVGVPDAGVHRLRLRTTGGLEAETNPLDVSPSAPRILWADLHGHSNYSDGTGLPEDYFRYARDVAGLNVAALSDHDHWGMEFLDAHPTLWADIVRVTRAFHEPGRFVTLLAFEWTNWAYGHRHVLYFADDGPLVSSLAPATDRPDELWAALDGHDALTVAHHPAGGPIAIDWSIPPDPRFEPVTEVSSVHGSSEAADSPARIYAAVPGHYVRDALDRGYRLGFVGSGDTHDGHPGLGHLATGVGGVAAILTDEPTRAGVLAALRARRTYATSGPRIVLRFSVDSTPMGGTLPPAEDDTLHALVLRAIGTGPIARIDLVRSGRVILTAEQNDTDVTFATRIPRLEPGEYVYARVVQRDGALAWSSPVFAADRAAPAR